MFGQRASKIWDPITTCPLCSTTESGTTELRNSCVRSVSAGTRGDYGAPSPGLLCDRVRYRLGHWTLARVIPDSPCIEERWIHLDGDTARVRRLLELPPRLDRLRRRARAGAVHELVVDGVRHGDRKPAALPRDGA